MKSDLTRLKEDLEVIQKAMGLAPAPGREWAPWLRKDAPLYLLFCLPGAVLLFAELVLPMEGMERYGGLRIAQWTGLLTAVLLLGILLMVMRRAAGGDGRPAGLIREYRRANRHVWLILPPLGLYFIWGYQYNVGAEAFTAGLWILSASLLGLLAALSGLRVYWGWAFPMAVYGLGQPWIPAHFSGVALGVVFIAGALLCSLIHKAEIRRMEKPHESH